MYGIVKVQWYIRLTSDPKNTTQFFIKLHFYHWLVLCFFFLFLLPPTENWWNKIVGIREGLFVGS